MAITDTRALRNVLGCYATGVAVVTGRTPGGDRIGITVNSFASLSLDPPLILFSLARTANVLAGFQQADSFAVNILSHEQEALSNMFARPSTAAWSDVDQVANADGCALIANSIAQLECTKSAELEGGDHLIFVGEITRFHMCEVTDPLLFYRGRYGTYASDRWSKLPPIGGTLSDFSVTGWG